MIEDVPLLNALSSASISHIADLASQNLANMAWSCSILLCPNMPLLNAISSESIPRITDFDSQGLSNTAWSFARLMLRDPPLLEAISSSALPNIDVFLQGEQQESYAMLWAMWRIGDEERMMVEFRRSALTAGGVSDALVRSLLLAAAAWCGDAAVEQGLQAFISSTLPSCSLTYVVSQTGPSHPEALRVLFEENQSCHFYKRLARLLDATDSVPAVAEEVLLRIEAFGSVSSWLKVAGDDKAACLAGAINSRPPQVGECTLELGAFVGYSAIRFARQVSSLRGSGSRDFCGMSLEIDPIHVAVSRHHLDRALLSLHAEIWVGQLQDTMPRVVEALGANCLAFIFMDQRGTTFHEDLAKLEGMTSIAPLANTTADNTLKPGSPVYLWHMCVGAVDRFATVMWAMTEFALEDIEDWQSVSLTFGSRT